MSRLLPYDVKCVTECLQEHYFCLNKYIIYIDLFFIVIPYSFVFAYFTSLAPQPKQNP
jgi:hypothetical protein